MTLEITCPRCGQLVDAQARFCQVCGIDLALAVVLAENTVSLPAAIQTGAPIAPEILVPRLGDYLIERGVLTSQQLHSALEQQKAKAARGETSLLGQTLLELGLIDREMLDQVITEQILHLQAALQQSNRQLEQRVQERTHELQKALNKLAELNQLKSNFISNISHELRTPLTHIKGYLDLLGDGSLGPLTSEQSDALDVLLRAEGRLEHLIDDLIRFSLAVRGEFSLKMGPVSVDELVQRGVERSAKSAAKKNILLNTDVAPNLPTAWVDEEKIGWVILQLLDNAIKFTEPNGAVAVDVSSEANIICVAVRDTGIGIPPERISEIFEPFHQLDSSNTRTYGGTGMGLALVRRIIEAHGSEIKVESEAGKGTHLEFFLPVAKSNDVQ